MGVSSGILNSWTNWQRSGSPRKYTPKNNLNFMENYPFFVWFSFVLCKGNAL